MNSDTTLSCDTCGKEQVELGALCRWPEHCLQVLKPKEPLNG